MVALDDDFAIFGRTADAAFLLQEFAERLEVVGRTDETAHERHGLAASSSSLHAQPQFLLLLGQGLVFLGLGFLIGEIGSVRKLGCKQQAYAHSFVNLKRKKGISATPLN